MENKSFRNLVTTMGITTGMIFGGMIGAAVTFLNVTYNRQEQNEKFRAIENKRMLAYKPYLLTENRPSGDQVHFLMRGPYHVETIPDSSFAFKDKKTRETFIREGVIIATADKTHDKASLKIIGYRKDGSLGLMKYNELDKEALQNPYYSRATEIVKSYPDSIPILKP